MKKTVRVIQEVDVEVDEKKFTKDFMHKFRQMFYDFKTMDEHICYLANLKAHDIDTNFIEGYGNKEDMGIVLKLGNVDVEIYQTKE